MLLPPGIKEALDFLIQIRPKMGILEDNKFLFAIPGHGSHMRGDAVLRRFSIEFNLEKPSYFTRGGLRKYLATTMQVSFLNLLNSIKIIIGWSDAMQCDAMRYSGQFLFFLVFFFAVLCTVLAVFQP
jgi:hypothetical protein